jgi:hypothetical protein
MRHLRPALLFALVVSAVLVGSVALSHAHHAGALGLYNTQCPLNDWAGHEIVPLVSVPAMANWDAPTAPLFTAPEAAALDVVPTPTSARAPPSR